VPARIAIVEDLVFSVCHGFNGQSPAAPGLPAVAKVSGTFGSGRGWRWQRAAKALPLPRLKKRIMVMMVRQKTCGLSVMLLVFLWACAAGPRGEAVQSSWSCDTSGDSSVQSGNWSQALLQHQAFLATHPGNCLAIYHLGYIWGHLGEREKEIVQYEQALACGYRDDPLFFNLGMAYAEMGQVEKAVSVFTQAVALHPQNADNHFGLGLTARSAGQAQLAAQALEKAVQIDPRHWDARLELARLALDQGRLEAARAQLAAIQQGAPDHQGLQALWRIYHDRKVTVLEPGR
jgi:tetratricopeptide (TPR) repeat protein